MAEPTPTAVSPAGSSAERDDRSTVGALGVLALAWTLALGALALWVWNRPPVGLDTWFFMVDVTVAVVYGAVAALILSRRSHHVVAWIFALAAVGCGWSAFGWQYALRSFDAGGLPGERLLAGAVTWGWVPGTLALVMVVPWLVREPQPTGVSSLPGVGRFAVAAGWLVAIGVTATRVLDPYPWPDGEPHQPLGVRSEWWAGFVERSLPWSFAVVVALGAAATIDVARRWRAAPDRIASGLGWLLVGSAMLTVSFVPLVLPEHWVEGSVAVPTLTPLLHLISQAFLPAATVVVVLRQRLWGLDLALNRTLVHGLLSGALVLVYVLVVLAANEVAPASGVAAALAAGVVAVLVLPLRAWLQGRVDTLVLGAAADPGAAMRRMGRVLDGDDPRALVADVATHLASSFRLGSVRVDRRTPEGDEALAAVGQHEGPLHCIDLEHSGETVGRLSVTAPYGERLDRRTLAALRDAAPLVATTVRLVDLNDETARIGEQLHHARVAERRSLRRDLHDGLGPALAGIGLGLQAYRNLRSVDVQAAEELFDTLCDEVDRRVDDVRELSRQLLPPVLDDVGLLPALHELADRIGRAGMKVEVASGGRGAAAVDPTFGLDPAVATAVYALASEALVNAQRHGDARHAFITVGRVERPDGCAVHVEVRNDGRPFDPGAAAGIGLRSMRERTAELGGTFELIGDGASPGVRAVFPCQVTQ